MAVSLTFLAGALFLAVSSVLPQARQATLPVESSQAEPQLVVYIPRMPVVIPPEHSIPERSSEVQSSEGGHYCRVGLIVMVPDGREGRVTGLEGDTCSVLAYGEAYLSLWNADMIEPVYPQDLPMRKFGH